MIEVDRRHLLAILGAGLTTTGQTSPAASPSQEIAQRLAQAEQDGFFGTTVAECLEGRLRCLRDRRIGRPSGECRLKKEAG
jgi:hypothetical protein